MTTPLQIPGLDNHNNPRQDFADKLFSHGDKELGKLCEEYIWLSAFASNNPRSDYHWQCDACYDECRRRCKPKIYTDAWEKVSKQ